MGRPARNILGQRFGMLEVIARDSTKPDGEATWICKCDCGNTKSIRGSVLVRENGTKSCGCLIGNPMDLTGEKYGTLTVIKRAENKGKKKMWLCKCDCGNEVIVAGGNLRNGHTQHCLECGYRLTGLSIKTHGKSNTPLFGIWHGMITRCEDKTVKAYKDYGGRGISVCEEWRNDFQKFYDWAVNNGYQKGLQIDRINNDGNYEPSNCRFVTQVINANNKRSNVIIEHNGEKNTIAEWARYYNVNYKNLWGNLSKGDSLEEAVRRIQTGDRSHRR